MNSGSGSTCSASARINGRRFSALQSSLVVQTTSFDPGRLLSTGTLFGASNVGSSSE